MFRTKAAAEDAAINGKGREWDSQDCREFQAQVLSSSPREPPDDDTIASRVQTDPDHHDQILLSQWISQHADIGATSNPIIGSQSDPAHEPEPPQQPQRPLETTPTDSNETPTEHVGLAHTQFEEDRLGEAQKFVVVARRDGEGRLRYYHQRNGTLIPLPRPPVPGTQTMEEPDHDPNSESNVATQKSSMSMTQENPESVYERFRALVPRSEPDPNVNVPAKNSTVSDSNHTYGENDTGHVNFDLQVLQMDDAAVARKEYSQDEGTVNGGDDNEEEEEERAEEVIDQASQDLVSQDPVQTLSLPHVGPGFDPQTPAPPVNPFKRKGSVMKAHELFGATQPSSLGRFQSPTSSRPSPDVFNNYSSPRLVSSPLLARAGPGTELNEGLSSPIKSPEPADIAYQPRAYRSMKESQQRRLALRNEQQGSDSESDSDVSVSTVEASVKRRKLDQVIRRNLSAVTLRQPKENPHVRFSSSFPSTKTPNDEIPSTSRRRRSNEDEYLAQCSGLDARDTQQEDVIVDSQVLPDPDLSADDEAPPHGHPEPENSIDDARVPETSPPSDRDKIRPMADIASFSFSADDNLNLEDLAGFTQDDEFEKAMRGRRAYRSPSNNPIVVPPVAKSFQTAGILIDTSLSAPSTSSEPGAPNEEDLGSTQDTTEDVDVALISRDAIHDVPNIPYQTDNVTTTLDNSTTDNTKAAHPVQLERQMSYDESKIRGKANPSSTPPIVSVPVIGSQDVTEPNGRDAEHTSGAKTTLNEKISQPQQSQKSLAVPAVLPAPQTQSPVSSALSSLVGFDSNDELSPAPSLADELAMSTADDTESTPFPGKQKKAITSSLRKKSSSLNSKKRKGITGSKAPMTRVSTRLRESSDDPLAAEDLTTPTTSKLNSKSTLKKTASALFGGMAFAISYVGAGREKVTKLVIEHGGQIFEDGFDSLFSNNNDVGVELLSSANETGFTALIADTHSRKVKYIQALALGLPCISGVWITACIAKNELVDWSPYLLCAGQSSLLNACRSRILKPYPAGEATLPATINNRDKLLDGKSIMLITGKGKQAETRKAYLFIARVLGPSRVSQVVDLAGAKKKLAESEAIGETWDLIYVDKNEEEAASSLFGTFAVSITAGNRKRKHRSSETPDIGPNPKRVRVISDEVVIQSLIFGQLLDE